ncbi:uncharacterized protein [Ambystoma mexicanum]|uniref:uncharacterized protein isoform X2 n=1 Tax=Ambystoma mexicanum TaxID=8296 RepID=UPI0037E750B3
MESPGSAPSWILLAAALCLWTPEQGESKVYYSCGAVMSSIERGLILSPGFPNHYYPGTHCVWQFFIPAGTKLILEVFDFDVFDGTGEGDPSDRYVYPFKRMSQDTFTEEDESSTPTPTAEPFIEDAVPTPEPSPKSRVPGGLWGEPTGDHKKGATGLVLGHGLLRSLDDAEAGHGLLQSTLQAIFEANRPSWRQAKNSLDGRKRVGGGSKFAQDAARQKNTLESEDDKYPKVQTDMIDSAMPWTTETSPTLPLPAELCPQDVLYISDLTTFSSRFCGENSPRNKSLVFSSPSEMMEVIMELITTTNRGRGFLMLFDYQNDSVVSAMNLHGHRDGEHMVALAIIAGVAAFAAVLLGTMLLVYRRHLCAKRSPSSAALGEPESGIQNAAVDINELQLVVPGRENVNNNHTVAQGHTGGQSDPAPRMAPGEVSSFVSEPGSEGVFVTRDFDFATYPVQKDNCLRRSMTSPSSVSDWHTWDPSAGISNVVDPGDVSPEPDPPRHRTWSVRTFHDILAPLPKLQKKWCSWTTGSPFIKLVDSGSLAATGTSSEDGSLQSSSSAHARTATEPLHSESSINNASFPPSGSAQRHRKVYTGNLKKPRFGSPYFGFQASLPDGGQLQSSSTAQNHSSVEIPHLAHQTGTDVPSPGKCSLSSSARTKDICVEIEKAKPVAFLLSEEEEDQRPLVLAEHLHAGGDVEQGAGRIVMDTSELRPRPGQQD